MERFALAAAVVLGFALTAALCSLFVPLRRVLERREQQQQPVQSEQPRPAPLRAPLWGGLCAAAGTVAAVGVGWLAACVGQPELRFEEDALRMFRAIRFSARLGFEIEPETEAAIVKKAPLAAALAAERIRDEVEKILLTKRPEKLLELIQAGLLDRCLIRRLTGDALLRRLSVLPKKALPRWAAFCRILEQGGCIRSTEEFLLSLRLDSRTIRCCTDCGKILEEKPPETSVEWKRLLSRKGVDTVTCAAQCGDALYGGRRGKALKAVLKSGECFSMKHLAVTGDDLLALGIHGRQLGEMLKFLLDYVMEYPENNRRELLLSLARCSEEN